MEVISLQGSAVDCRMEMQVLDISGLNKVDGQGAPRPFAMSWRDETGVGRHHDGQPLQEGGSPQALLWTMMASFTPWESRIVRLGSHVSGSPMAWLMALRWPFTLGMLSRHRYGDTSDSAISRPRWHSAARPGRRRWCDAHLSASPHPEKWLVF